MEERLARVSGATLGYIWNNIPGAIDGYYAAGQAYKASRMAYRIFKNRFNNTRTYKTPKKIMGRRRILPQRPRSNENTTTTQLDTTTQYRYKRMPKKKRWRWKKFVKKVQAVQQRALGLRTVLFNTNIRITGAANQQHYGCVALYGYYGVGDAIPGPAALCGMRDIFRIANNDPQIMDKNTAGVDGGKFQLQSGILDVTATNVGARSLEVDLYEINCMEDDTKESDPLATIGNAQVITSAISGTSTSIDLAQRGATLFDLPNAISNDKWKIYKKRKYFVPSGASFTFQHRDPRNYLMNGADFRFAEGGTNKYSYARRRQTRLFFFVAKNVAGYDNATVDLQIGATRKYSYVIQESSIALDAFNPDN